LIFSDVKDFTKYKSLTNDVGLRSNGFSEIELYCPDTDSRVPDKYY